MKRLNNDAAVKAETWRTDFGTTQVVPAAVLSGVYKLHNLEEAQKAWANLVLGARFTGVGGLDSYYENRIGGAAVGASLRRLRARSLGS